MFLFFEILFCVGVIYAAYYFLIKPYGLAERYIAPIVSFIDSDTVTFPEDSEYANYWEYEPDQRIVVNEPWLSEPATYTINADALNDELNYPVEKDPQTLRVVTLGDSFTFGFYVNTANNWPSQLEKMLNASECQYSKYEVINVAMPGFDVPYIVERYKQRGAKYDPDLIIWFEGGSGFTRYNDFTQPLVDECIAKSGKPHQTGAKENHLCWGSVIAKLQNEYSRKELDVFMAKSYSDLAAVTSAPVHFFYFEDVYKKYQSSVQEFNASFSTFEFFGTVPNLTKGTVLLDDSHPNTQGHKVIAETIFNQVCEYSK